MNIGYYKNEKIKIQIKAQGEEIIEIKIINNTQNTEKENENLAIKQCKNQLEKYFKGELKKFNLKIKTKGTDFQKQVWEALTKLEYGKTVTYKKVAEMIEKPKAIRAVANAIAKNQIWIVIPCHRVIGSNGKLTGYAGGLENKKYLLEIEKVKI